MDYLPAIFALIVAGAGWFYIMHGGRAKNLAGIETSRDNALRIRLRRMGGAAMILLAAAFYVGYVAAQRDGRPILVLVCMGAVVLLLPVILLLAWVDLRLTRKMRESIRRRQP